MGTDFLQHLKKILARAARADYIYIYSCVTISLSSQGSDMFSWYQMLCKSIECSFIQMWHFWGERRMRRGCLRLQIWPPWIHEHRATCSCCKADVLFALLRRAFNSTDSYKSKWSFFFEFKTSLSKCLPTLNDKFEDEPPTRSKHAVINLNHHQ